MGVPALRAALLILALALASRPAVPASAPGPSAPVLLAQPEPPPTTAAPTATTATQPLFSLPSDQALQRPSVPPAPGPLRGPAAAAAVETVQPVTGVQPAPSAPNPAAPPATTTLPPFGSQLFSTQPKLFGPIAFNRDYIVGAGDQVSIKVWGSYNYGDVQGVDPQGNIFIPQVGPIHIAGRTNDELNAIVTAAVKRVFTQNVEVYASLLSKQPVAVYVTGAVKTPGRYSGDRLDSALQYLGLAGGIDPKSGSYRDIRIWRGSRLLAHFDLYSFLTGGQVPPVEFEVNDRIDVGFQRPTVSAFGDVQNSYRFEFSPGTAAGSDLVALTRPDPTVSNVSVQGIRDGRPYNAYVSLAEFRGMRLSGGDTLRFTSDYVSDTIFVNVTGQSNGPSSFVVPRSARLGDVLRLIEVDPAVADLQAIYLRRQSVAQAQQQALDQDLDQLKRSVLTKRAVSTSDAAINTEEAQLVQAFLQQIKAFTPQGIVVLADARDRDAFRLEPNDQIVIPAKSDVVLVTGEVRLPQTLTFEPGMAIGGYIERAGGLTDRADTKNLVVLHLSGAVATGPAVRIDPGDQIMVMPRVDVHGFAIFSDIVRIIYEVAVSSAIAVRLTGL